MKIVELEETDSTNEYIKRGNFCEDTAVFAARQTSGRGTKGRSFISDEGGLYVSVLRIYRDFDFSSAFGIMVNACVAVCRTLESFGLHPVIKWANDVLVGGRKICGTLIENTFCSDNVCRSVVGIGLNVNNALAGLANIATSMSEQAGRKFCLADVKSTLLEMLGGGYSVAEYKRYIDWFGRKITLVREGERQFVTALDVDAGGRLVVRTDDGRVTAVSSGEMSLILK